MKWLTHSQTPTVASLTFPNGYTISPHTLLWMQLLSHAGIKVKPCWQKGPWSLNSKPCLLVRLQHQVHISTAYSDWIKLILSITDNSWVAKSYRLWINTDVTTSFQLFESWICSISSRLQRRDHFFVCCFSLQKCASIFPTLSEAISKLRLLGN